MEIVMVIVIGVFGMLLGSFAGASVWRLRARELEDHRRAKRPYDRQEFSRLKPLLNSVRHDRSRCLRCHHTLVWYDLIPIVSWVVLRGKCRYCHHPIGIFELLIEIGVALSMILSLVFWPISLDSPLRLAQFSLWIIAIVIYSILFAYDLKWMTLPLRLTITAMIPGALFAGLRLLEAPQFVEGLISLAAGLCLLAGLYYVLYLFSKGLWVGGGDYKLAVSLALFLGTWQNAFAALFFANLIGCIVVLPGMMSGKLSRASAVPLGPFLIVGAFIAFLAEPMLAQYFSGLTNGVSL